MINLNKAQWKTYNFGEISFNISERVEPKQTDLDIYVGLEHLDSDCLHIKRKGNPSDVKGIKLRVYPGDIIFGKRRAYQRKAAIVDFDGICSAHAMVVRANPKIISPALLPHFIHSDLFMHRAVDISEGSLSPTIKWKILTQQQFKLPPLDEQKRIADLLWSIDDAVEKNNALLIVLDNLIRSYIKGIIDNAKYPKFMIKDIANVTSGNPAPQGEKYFHGNNKFIRVQHIPENNVYVSKCDFINDVAVKDCRLKLFPAKTILFPKSGASVYLEKKAMLNEPSYVVSHLCAVNANESRITSSFLFYLFKGSQLSKYCASGYPTIDLSNIKQWSIPLPSLSEQEKIVRKINLSEESKQKIEGQTNNLREIKKQIINQIFG